MVMLINTLFQIVMHKDTLNTKYDADVKVKQLVRSMGNKFQKLGVNKKFFLLLISISCFRYMVAEVTLPPLAPL